MLLIAPSDRLSHIRPARTNGAFTDIGFPASTASIQSCQWLVVFWSSTATSTFFPSTNTVGVSPSIGK